MKLPLSFSLTFGLATFVVGTFAPDAMSYELKVTLFWLGVVLLLYSLLYASYLMSAPAVIAFVQKRKAKAQANRKKTVGPFVSKNTSQNARTLPLIDAEEYDLIPVGASARIEYHSDGVDIHLTTTIRNRSPRNLKIGFKLWTFEIGGKNQPIGRPNSGCSTPMRPSTSQTITSGKIRFYKPDGEIPAWVEAAFSFGGVNESDPEYIMYFRYDLVIPPVPKSGVQKVTKIDGVKVERSKLRYEKPSE
ncbi:hypothetical protein [Glycocaulis sp.]|uniref:hypothetical protein n=1 Tax=Glycocaulis sp. TaxID=1969725 RepID=UPI003D217B64